MREGDVGNLVLAAFRLRALRSPRGLAFFLRNLLRIRRAEATHRRMQEGEPGIIPTILAISPTMRCNLDCAGCYSRSRSEDEELSTEEFRSLLDDAERLGVSAVVLTGGEPLLRSDAVSMIEEHGRLFFVLISNGGPLTGETARRLAGSGNCLVLISLDGDRDTHDARRGGGSHERAMTAMSLLWEHRCPFGFASVNTRLNWRWFAGSGFLDEMIGRGCVLGLFTEYVPVGPAPRPDWIMGADDRDAFRAWVLRRRARSGLTMVQFPQDEYGSANRCTGAGVRSLHINAQGGIEPCPFVNVSVETIRDGGLQAACRSPYLASLRADPGILSRDRLACSLFEHLDAVVEHAARRASEEPSADGHRSSSTRVSATAEPPESRST